MVVDPQARPAERGPLANVLSPGLIGSLWLRNKVVMPPMVTNFAESDGQISEGSIRHYVQRARGGVGLVVVEASFVDPVGRGFPNGVGIASDEHLPGLERLTKAVRAEGARIGIQLFHAGGNSRVVNGQPAAPSPFHYRPELPVARELTTLEVGGLVERFVEAGKRAQQAGFELIQIHMAHCYLIHQFLSPITNQRTDRYGEDRLRFAVEVVGGLRRALVPGFPIVCRLGGADGRPDGLSHEDMQRIARTLVEAGIDAVDVSPRGFDAWLPSVDGPGGGYAYLAAGMKKAIPVPVVSVGRILDLRSAEVILAQGRADLVAIGRGLLADPYLVRKSAEGRADEVKCCDDCGVCHERLQRFQDIRCPVNPKLRKDERADLRR